MQKIMVIAFVITTFLFMLCFHIRPLLPSSDVLEYRCSADDTVADVLRFVESLLVRPAPMATLSLAMANSADIVNLGQQPGTDRLGTLVPTTVSEPIVLTACWSWVWPSYLTPVSKAPLKVSKTENRNGITYVWPSLSDVDRKRWPTLTCKAETPLPTDYPTVFGVSTRHYHRSYGTCSFDAHPDDRFGTLSFTTASVLPLPVHCTESQRDQLLQMGNMSTRLAILYVPSMHVVVVVDVRRESNRRPVQVIEFRATDTIYLTMQMMPGMYKNDDGECSLFTLTRADRRQVYVQLNKMQASLARLHPELLKALRVRSFSG